ncbi:MAG: DsrE family protein [Arcobacteraceae bacterium]|nr:DsrE family protein [Arcobacteraceae bacterium]
MEKLSKKWLIFFASITFVVNSYAQDMHKVVIQISSDDKQLQALALNNAVNLQNYYGIDNVDIVVVAYGPGLSALTVDSEESNRIKSLALQNIEFDACGNTMAKITKKTGKEPILTEGVKKIPAGVVKMVELQEAGYQYIRP